MSSFSLLADLLGTLHDGSITAWTGNHSRLTLTIDCQYIAEQLWPDFTLFYVELTDVSTLSLEVWADDEPIRHELAAVFEGELEMVNATVQGDCVLVTCYQFSQAMPYRGGNLRVACAAVQVVDEAHNALSVTTLKQLAANAYTNR